MYIMMYFFYVLVTKAKSRRPSTAAPRLQNLILTTDDSRSADTSSFASVEGERGNMAIDNSLRTMRNITIWESAARLIGSRTYAAAAGGAKSKKGSKGGAAGDAPKASTLSKEVKSTTVVGANIMKDGTDPKISTDSEYPGWLWHLLDKRPALSELQRKDAESLPYDELKRFVKLDNRARIKENNSVKAKN
ncbi:hypothetical protein Dimus_021931 [Dionaea muscipula]